MLQKYLFIPAVVSILGALVVWSHHLGPRLLMPSLTGPAGQSVEMKLIQPHHSGGAGGAGRGVSSVLEPQKLEIEPLSSDESNEPDSFN